MLGRALRGRQLQWRLRHLLSITEAECGVTCRNAAPLSPAAATRSAAPAFTSTRPYSTMLKPSPSTEVQQFHDAHFGDQHFIQHDLESPLFRPDEGDGMQESADVIWKKYGGDENKDSVEEWMKDVEVTRELINRLLIRFLSRHQTGKALELMEWAVVKKKAPYEITQQDRMTFIYIASMRGEVKKSTVIFNSLEEDQKTAAYEILLRAHAKACKKKAAEKWLLKMKEKNLVSTPGPYNCVLDVVLHHRDRAGAKKYVDEMAESGIAADAETYRLLLEYRELLQPEVVDDVKAKSEVFLEEGRAKNEVFLGAKWRAMIGLAGEMGKAGDVTRMWEEMSSSSAYVPDHYYFSAAGAFLRVDEGDMFEQLCKDVVSRRQKLTVKQCSFMIRACSRDGAHMEKAEYVLATARAKGVGVKFGVYELMIFGYMTVRNKRNASKAAKTFRKYLDDHPKEGYLKCMEKAVPVLMDAYRLKGDVRGAERLLKMLQRPKFKPKVKGKPIEKDNARPPYRLDVVLWNSLLKVYARFGAGMYGAEERMKAFKGAPDEETTRLLKKVYPFAAPVPPPLKVRKVRKPKASETTATASETTATVSETTTATAA